MPPPLKSFLRKGTLLHQNFCRSGSIGRYFEFHNSNIFCGCCSIQRLCTNICFVLVRRYFLQLKVLRNKIFLHLSKYVKIIIAKLLFSIGEIKSCHNGRIRFFRTNGSPFALEGVTNWESLRTLGCRLKSTNRCGWAGTFQSEVKGSPTHPHLKVETCSRPK